MELMPTLGTGISTRHRRALTAGFSLLELMVVVAIIGLMAGTLVLSTNLGGSERQLEREVDRVRGLIGLMREEALMQNRDYGIEITATGYRFFVFDYEQLLWYPPPNEQLFVGYLLPEPLMFELALEDRDITLDREFDESVEDDATPEPQLLILSTGELTPFELSVYRDINGTRLVLDAQLDGTMEVRRNDSI